MPLRHGNGGRRGIYSDDMGTLARQGVRHEAAATAEIEHGLVAPVPDNRREIGKARRHHVMQESEPARLACPPVFRIGVVHRKIDLNGSRAVGHLASGCSRNPVWHAPSINLKFTAESRLE